jgi:hypothetical protein
VSRSGLRVVIITSAAALFAALAGALSFAAPATAADQIFMPGQPIVTGFSGTVAPADVPDGTDPLDLTFIDPDGKSVVIQNLEPDGPPAGQLIDAPHVFSVTAADVGQVFSVTLDDAPLTTGAVAPNIYVAATSAYGLNLVVPGADGNPIRSKTGAADAAFTPGQWGGAGGVQGYPGSIWKIDGETGEVTLFSTIAANTGAGLGNIVYDPASAQFFVSDLDTGLIYRLASDGTILDTYDHGVTGRPTHGLDAVEDDGSAVDVTSPDFNTEDPATWGFTQAERRVYGLAMRNSRLFYAVSASADTGDVPQIWSVAIKADGSFGTPRWELDVAGLPFANDITAIAFDPQGRMLLAQRGAQAGSYDYSVFAEPGTSSVVRYKREFPDDPATPSTWVAEPQSYAIGLASEGTAASGGLALGYGYNEAVGDFSGACGAWVWATGDQLRNNPDLAPPVEGPMQVSGLQGMIKSAVRPLNDPPTESFFTDYDGDTADASASQAGHVGSVAIWQVCEGPSAPTVPDLEPADDIPPPDYVPPEHYNLTLGKWSAPHFCFDGATDYWCTYTIRVENTGTVPYWGQVGVHDYLPANPPGATMTFWPQPPWSCAPAGPAAQTCTRGPVFLFPGDAVTLHEVVKLPKPVAPGVCNLVNVAGIEWPFFAHDEDPGDDFDGAIAFVPAPGCVPGGPGVADLTLSKFSFPGNCSDPGGGADYLCSYGVLVTNAGPGNYSGPIQVKDTLGVNAPATVFGPWTCGQVGPVLTCNINAAPVNVPPGWSSVFFVQAHMKKPVGPPACDLDNKAQIALPPGGSPNNVLPGNDFDTATTHILSPACLAPAKHTDIEVKKTADTCGLFVDFYCKWTLTITNVGPDPYFGPLKFTDKAVGATANNLPAVIGGGCAGPASNLTCTYPFVGLMPAVPHAFTFFTHYAVGPSACSATNTATIVNPNPGSVQNPSGNDSVSVSHAIPNPACAGLPALNLTKTAKGCSDDPGSTDWLCLFDIKLKNVGGAPQPAPIRVRDYNTKPTTFSTPACVPFAANTWQCTRAVPLAPGATWSFQATTRVNPNGVTLADCNVENWVFVSTPFSWDPGHFADATQKVPQLFINPGPGPVYVYCDPPSLKLAKTAGKTVAAGDGYDTTFNIKATSTGPDPYHGTIELDEVLPDGTAYKSSSWPCVPSSGNDVHCSSPYVDLPVGQSKSMTIVIHTSKAVAARNQCAITNTVNVAISAEVLHSDKGAQYTASATAKLPAEACAKPPACPPNQVKPGGGCCDTGLVWNGKQCAAPKPLPPPKPVPPKCPRDSVVGDNGACVCKDGTHGTPGKCVPDRVIPICPKDSVLSGGECQCKDGTHGVPGRCVPDKVIPICPRDSVLSDGECQCRDGTHGRPGKCVPDQTVPICPKDSVLSDGECQCKDGTHGTPGRCVPDKVVPICPKDSVLSGGECQCKDGTHGVPGRCIPDKVVPICPRDSVLSDGECQCKEGTHGVPGRCQPDRVIVKPPVLDVPLTPVKPVIPQCPDDSHYNARSQSCVCNAPLTGKPGACRPQLQILRVPQTQTPVIK